MNNKKCNAGVSGQKYNNEFSSDSSKTQSGTNSSTENYTNSGIASDRNNNEGYRQTSDQQKYDQNQSSMKNNNSSMNNSEKSSCGCGDSSSDQNWNQDDNQIDGIITETIIIGTLDDDYDTNQTGLEQEDQLDKKNNTKM